MITNMILYAFDIPPCSYSICINFQSKILYNVNYVSPSIKTSYVKE